jgi:hypothetical protein
VEKVSPSGKYKIQVSWSPPEIIAERANTYIVKFLDGNTGKQLTGTIRYDFMFMPASDPEVMIIHRGGQTASGGQDEQSFTFKEKRVGSDTLRISRINGNNNEYVDFPITVLPPNNASSSSSSPENKNSTILNMTEYQTAQALTNRIQELFVGLKESAPPNSTNTIYELEDGIKQLKVAIDGRAPIEDVEVLVHGQIHPNLQATFNLQLVPEFPTPILLVAPLLAALLIIARVNHKKVKGR